MTNLAPLLQLLLRAALCLVLLHAGLACGGPRPPHPQAAAAFASKSISESSGLVGSHRYAGVFWTHNDSAGGNRIFGVTAGGRLLREVTVVGAENVDWEAVTLDEEGYLYHGHLATNAHQRRDLVVYRAREPDPHTEDRTEVVAEIPFHYPEQTRFPDESRRNFDAEALFWARGKLYLLTKHRSDTFTTLYRFPSVSGTSPVALERLASFDLGRQRHPPPAANDWWLRYRVRSNYAGMATGAAATRDGRHLAVLSYHALFVFARPQEGDNYLETLVKRIDFDETATRQTEAVAWDGDDLLLTNEGGEIYRIEDVLEREIRTYPPGPGRATGPS